MNNNILQDLQNASKQIDLTEINTKQNTDINFLKDFETDEICKNFYTDCPAWAIYQDLINKNGIYYLKNELKNKRFDFIKIKAFAFDIWQNKIYLININNFDLFIFKNDFIKIIQKYIDLQEKQELQIFNNNIKQILKQAKTIIANYIGKRLGTKTKEKLEQDLQEIANKFDINCYTNFYTENKIIQFIGKDYFKHNYKIQLFTDKENKIKGI